MVIGNHTKLHTECTIFLFRNYALNAIEMTVFLMQMKDTCAEGDGERNDLNMKRLLLYFKSHKHVSIFFWTVN